MLSQSKTISIAPGYLNYNPIFIGHFCDPIEYPDSENPAKELFELKSVELEEMLRKTTKMFDFQHSLLQILEDQRIKEIAQVYEDRFKAIDFRKPLNRVSSFQYLMKTKKIQMGAK